MVSEGDEPAMVAYREFSARYRVALRALGRGSIVDAKRIPARGGAEEDVFTGWRRVLCYTLRPGVCKRVKRSYWRRFRRLVKRELRRGG